MREQFYLALPMKPLCGDGLPGLCPQCGTNLNTETVRLRDRSLGRSAAGCAESRLEGPTETADLEETQTMPNPKRRHSKTRTAKRRTHDALKRGRDRPSARSATSRSRRTASAPTAATTAAARSGRSTKSRPHRT